MPAELCPDLSPVSEGYNITAAAVINDFDNTTCLASPQLTFPYQAFFSVNTNTAQFTVVVVGGNIECKVAGAVQLKVNYKCVVNPDTCGSYYRYCTLQEVVLAGTKTSCFFMCPCVECKLAHIKFANLGPNIDQSTWEICDISTPL